MQCKPRPSSVVVVLQSRNIKCWIDISSPANKDHVNTTGSSTEERVGVGRYLRPTIMGLSFSCGLGTAVLNSSSSNGPSLECYAAGALTIEFKRKKKGATAI